MATCLALRRWRDSEPGRAIPKKAPGRLLLATWNIANLGVQDRLDSDYKLIAEMIGWFDLVAVQEVNDNLRGILAIRDHLPDSYELLFSDASGNQGRQAFLYDRTKVRRLEEVGRLSIPPSQARQIKLRGAPIAFPGFDRGPYLGSFESGNFQFALVNVHLYFGRTKRRASRGGSSRRSRSPGGQTGVAATRTGTSPTRFRSATSTCPRPSEATRSTTPSPGTA